MLAANKGAALVVCGSNDVNIQTAVNAINQAIGAGGTTIDWSATSNVRKGIDADIVKLDNDMAAGNIGGVLVYDCNPVYSYMNGKKFGESLAKLPLSVSFNSTLNETAEQCKYILPAPHWLESWGDAEPVTGYISVIQPIINPLFKTRPFQSSLLKWSGAVATAAAKPAAADTLSNKKDTTAHMMPVASTISVVILTKHISKIIGPAKREALMPGIKYYRTACRNPKVK